MEKIKLNPEIKKQADKLFKLIEEEIEKHHEDTVAETIRDEWGSYLKNSKGFDQLMYGYELTLNRSEEAIYGLEESFNRMNDKTASLIFRASDYGIRVAEEWERKGKKNNDWVYRMDGLINLLKEESKAIRDKIDGLFIYRSEDYRREIETLKKKLKAKNSEAA